MLRTVKDLEHYSILATDGQIGKVRDLYFDDRKWILRYLVVDTGSWLSGREVLLSPASIGRADAKQKSIPSTLSKQKVKDSPEIDTHEPVSRQHEASLLDYYGYPYYWSGAGYWGDACYPPGLMLRPGETSLTHGQVEKSNGTAAPNGAMPKGSEDDPHLRSCNAVTGYHVEAKDGELGHVAGMIFDDESWALRYLIVETSNWWMGHKVLVAPQWITELRWDDRTVGIKMTRHSLKEAPRYDSTTSLDRPMEVELYEHHGDLGYWLAEDEARGAALIL